MKQIYTFGLAICATLAVASCAKENTTGTSDTAPITVKASFEEVNNPDTKITIVEGASKFNLNWDGDETFRVYNSTNNKGGVSNDFTISSHSGASATFTGTPSAADGTGNFIATFNPVSSETSYVKADLPYEQTYSEDGAIASNCLLIGRTDGVTNATLSTFSFKTMNAFMKFSLKKGSAAAGSSNVYTKMFVKSIKVETVADGEVLAGRFGFNKTGAWGSVYDYIIAANAQSQVILNCVTAGFANGVELDPSTATDFYVAVAFGSFSKGLKVTVSVQNQDGDLGIFEKTISNGKSYNIARNTLVSMPALVVNPDDTEEEIICWSENWNGATYSTSASDSATPSACGSTGTYVYGGGSVTYTESANSVYVRNDTNAGGKAPELMITSGKTWTISGIPTAGGTTLSLTYKSNNTKSSVALSGADKASISGSSKSYTITTGGDATITLVFSCSGNTRIDDVVLKVSN